MGVGGFCSSYSATAGSAVTLAGSSSFGSGGVGALTGSAGGGVGALAGAAGGSVGALAVSTGGPPLLVSA